MSKETPQIAGTIFWGALIAAALVSTARWFHPATFDTHVSTALIVIAFVAVIHHLENS